MTAEAGISLVDYLSTKGIRTYRAAGQEVTAACWWCNDGKANKRKLYLNVDSWLYSCKVCDAHGNRRTLLEYFGDEERYEYKWAPGTDPALRRKALTEAIALAQEMLYGNPAVLDYLTSTRGLDPQTIVDARIGYAPVSWGLGRSLLQTNTRADLRHAGIVTPEGQEFFSGHILIPYVSHGHIVQVRGKEYVPEKINGKYVSTIGDDVRLYGSDTLHGAKEAIVVEGEFDALALRQALRKSGEPRLMEMAVVGLAGAMVLPPGFDHMFDDCARVYLGLDPDDTGELASEKIKTLLPGKTRKLGLPEELPKCDWSDYLSPQTPDNPHGGHTWRDAWGLIQDADLAGRTLFSIRDAQRAMARLAKEKRTGVQLGFYDLDRYIDPGLKPGQLLIPIARTGAGKTSLLSTLTYNVRSKPTLVLSLEMTAVEYYDRLRRAALFWNPLATDEDIAREYAKVRIFDATIGEGDMTRKCEEFTEEVGEPPQMVMLDYIGYASRRFKGSSQYERTTACVMAIKEEAKAGGFGLIAPHQAGRAAADGVPVRAEDARDSGAIEDTADIMLGLFRPGDASKGTNDCTVSCAVLKNRNGRKDVLSHFVFSLASLVLVQKGSREGQVADDENRLILTGETYSSVLAYRRQQALARGVHQPQLSP